MNAIATHFAGADFLHQEEIELLKRLWHARQESTFLPTL